MPRTFALDGVKQIVLFRILGDEGNAWKVAFQTEDESEESRDYDAEQTKDGSVSSPGGYEATKAVTAFLQKDSEELPRLQGAIRNPDQMELWNLDTTDAEAEDTSTIPGEYSICNMTSLSISNPTDGKVEVSMDFDVDGKPVNGRAEVTPELLSMIQSLEDEIEFVQPTQSEDEGGGEIEGA